MSHLRLCLWSGPRNVSTALMYSFAQRSDTVVIDEPLYGHYLHVTNAPHPGRDQILAQTDCDATRVIRDTILGPASRPVVFCKQMAHHLTPDLDREFLLQTTNVLLIRDPRDVLKSLSHQLENPQIGDTGIAIQSELYDQLVARDREPAVVDSRLLLLDPKRILSLLCEHLGLDFQESMLSWPAGARPEDGIWAPHWYSNVHRSTGFRPYSPSTSDLPDRLEPVAEQCLPHYRHLFARALR